MMKQISYCSKCHECFTKWPHFYWMLYRRTIEVFIVFEEFYAITYMQDSEDQNSEHRNGLFIERLEQKGLIITKEMGEYMIQLRPNGINFVEDNREDGSFLERDDHYFICLDIQRHYAYEMDENVKEE